MMYDLNASELALTLASAKSKVERLGSINTCNMPFEKLVAFRLEFDQANLEYSALLLQSYKKRSSD